MSHSDECRYPRRRFKAEPGKYAGQDDSHSVQDLTISDEEDSGSDEKEDVVKRRSVRSNRFQLSMKEPQGISDLLARAAKENRGHNRKKDSSASSSDENPERNSRRNRGDSLIDALTDSSNVEYRGRHRASKKNPRMAKSSNASNSSQRDVDSTEESSMVDQEEDQEDDSFHEDEGHDDDDQDDDGHVDNDRDDDGLDGDDNGPPRVQRIIGSKTERRKVWKEICSKMNSREIDNGSIWHQREINDDGEAFEERFLIKWADLSYLHCSWETAKDLEDLIENSKTYFHTFFRKSKDGVLFSPEERSDGEYFDPAFTQIERIIECDWPENCKEWTTDEEDSATTQSLGIVIDKDNPGYEKGLGRQLYIKWCNQPYDESTYEFERDLIINEIEYKEQLKAFLKRRKKPANHIIKSKFKEADGFRRQLYKVFGSNSPMNEQARFSAVEDYQKSLRDKVFKNGGQVRDYQAEGISWMISNYLNDRSCILADEMGLGKTLQTAASVDIILSQMRPASCCLVVAPLSTIPHWLREFQSWTDLNAIIYHGSAKDRRKIREYEMAYEEDRPATSNGVTGFLRRCKNRKGKAPWMVQVVISTPEMLITEDALELSSIDWEVLVVDEAHRLKNHKSKLTSMLSNNRFAFNFKILCTGTPIQNDMKELWTLLHFIDKDLFQSQDDFLEKYGNMTTKETVDELHEMIRPYILRRLKEDVEKSMPPKEETIIEVELTLSQKQYYRALYEKNVKFLYKDKSKALDGPSLNNLQMQLRKCCNHVCLLNGIEETLRKQHSEISDADFLVKGSGKLVLLDKLLPRLKEEGHRVLIFSQFKIMLDVLEDYLVGRGMSFARIDGCITGLRRQAAIDAYQSKKESAPFIMMLSTRAGGVGINLTAADTVIIFDSDWNPQNDIQAQARCHRIGQERPVKVYRLLSARTYEMHMFDLSSLKMGLDHVVLKGFECSSEGALSKAEVEKLLKYGAYAIFAEEKDGKSEVASTEFVEQDIDSILERRSRTIVHDSGSGPGSAGGTFSKASFKVAKSPNKNGCCEDVDVDDPDFWKKMVGDSYKHQEPEAGDLVPSKRRKAVKDYSEGKVEGDIDPHDVDYTYESDDDEEDEQDGHDSIIELKGPQTHQWKKDQIEKLERLLYSYGYGNLSWETVTKFLDIQKLGSNEVKQMAWALVLTVLVEAALVDSVALAKRAQRTAEKQREISESSTASKKDGGVLVFGNALDSPLPSKKELIEVSFKKLLDSNNSWLGPIFQDAVDYCKEATPRDPTVIARLLLPNTAELVPGNDSVTQEFAKIWKSLQNRGWKAVLITDGPLSGQSVFSFKNESFGSIDEAVRRARREHPELSQVLDNIVQLMDIRDRLSADSRAQMRDMHLAMTCKTATADLIDDFLRCYAPLQLLTDRANVRSMNISRRIFVSSPLMAKAFEYVQMVLLSGSNADIAKRLGLIFSKKSRPKLLPHPEWNAIHDAVLVLAIYRHGYIELDNNYHGIISDKKILWGLPFDSIPVRTPAQVTIDNMGFRQLFGVAKRVAAMLGGKKSTENATEFSPYALISHFCLRSRPINQPSGAASSSVNVVESWFVDEDMLMKKHGWVFNKVAVPSPSKKDLSKRVKVLLGGSLPDMEQVQTEHYGLPVLDQKDPSNMLLAELLHSVVAQKPSRRLIANALEEAKSRFKEVCQLRDALGEPDEESKQRCDNIERIVKKIQRVEATINVHPQLSKNIVRVIIGEQPVRKSPAEPLFPSELPVNVVSQGKRAVQDARKRELEKGFAKNDGGSSAIHLTETETLILSAACSCGVPVWEKNWKERECLDRVDSGKVTGWGSFGGHLRIIAMTTLKETRDIHQEALKQYREKMPPGQSSHKDALSAAQRFLDFATRAQPQVEAYGAQPEVLAKKTVLLLAKLLKKMGRLSVSSQSHTVGSNVVKWLSDQVSLWSRSLGLLDSDGAMLTLTAVDFFEDITQEQRLGIDVSSCFDRQGCWDVFCQIASVSRLRSIFMNYNDENFTRVQQAIERISQKFDYWEDKPASWQTGSDDLLLLQRLLSVGFYALSGSEISVGVQSYIDRTSYSKLNLSEATLQSRINDLVRELHEIEVRAAVSAVTVQTRSPEYLVDTGFGDVAEGGSYVSRSVKNDDLCSSPNKKTRFV